MSERRLLSVKDFAKKHPSFPEGGLRHMIFRAKARLDSRGCQTAGNGLEEIGAVIRLGHKVLLDEQRFFDWIDAQQYKAA